MFTDKKQKTIKLDTGDHKIKYGLLNKKSDSIYINFSSWVKIKENDFELDYNREFRLIRKKIKTELYLNIDKDLFDSLNYIVDLDIRQNGLSSKLKSFLVCEITLFKRNGYFELNDELDQEINKLINIIKAKCLNEQTLFKYYSVK